MAIDPGTATLIATGFNTLGGLFGGGGPSKEERDLAKSQRRLLDVRYNVGRESYWALPQWEKELSKDIDPEQLAKMSRMLQLANKGGIAKALQTAGARFGNRSGLTQEAFKNATIESLYIPLAQLYQDMYNNRVANIRAIYGNRSQLANV